ncbi:filamentous hemagglutinin N-terminal domain-containing protein [Moorena sp. SIO3H5]|uniref:two-partner secretion domain-containing protein n=1 Tax=Moorena sp. SIO3H5 TaxID=2607834 RepID=UPI0013BBD139|nr:filamentous hemagglutinin N-terminal domain-containing protein [Moorena sp. SIO3H5]NEO74014.1 filamentous hemagglutinin N-terminal domain-containing protein [Moorena sp. SIO3H5]
MNQTIQRCYLLCYVLVSSVLIPNIATAQISSDGTLSTTVTSDDGVNFLIESGVRTSDHLFHSFSEFSVPTNGSAFFNNAADIVNIFSRVTGGNISNIDGLIRANGNANLFLINPAGIIFGNNASVNIGGSFFATTAESVVFGNGIEFSATEPNQAPLLTINITPGLQMGKNPGNITVNGPGETLNGNIFTPFDRSNLGSQLQVEPGNTLALVGGEISLRGGLLSAEGGQIEIAAVGSNNSSAMVPLTPVGSGWDLDLSQVSNLGNIQLTENALVDTSGDTAGSIRIRGATITVGDNSIVLTQNEGSQNAGNTILHGTETVTIGENDANGSINTFVANLSISSGEGGDIDIITKNFNVLGGATVVVSTFDKGASGKINIVASESVVVMGFSPDNQRNFSSNVYSSTLSETTAGDITISTNQLRLVVANIIAWTFGEGDGGNITVNATESIEIVALIAGLNDQSVISSPSFGEGNGGSVEVNTRRLLLADGGVIDSSAFGKGNGGTITINASESVTLLDTLPSRVTPTNVSTNVSRPSIEEQRRFDLDPIPTAIAGDITINTSELTISGDPDTQDAQIRVTNEGIGDGGELFIQADTINLNYGARITASTFSGKGGDIELDITKGLLLRNGSTITAEAETKEAQNDGNGGNITIKSGVVALIEGSLINANANLGNGGNISITTQGLFRRDRAITASSDFGVDGEISINNPYTPANGLIELPTELRDRTQEIAKGCRWTATSSFYITGRGGIPQDPSAMVPGGQILSDVRDISDLSIVRAIPEAFDSKSDTNTKAPIVEANAWIINEQGNLELVAVVNSNQALDFLRATCAIKED